MPSHLKPYDVRPPGVSHLDIAGNNFADVEAGKAAKTFCVELNALRSFSTGGNWLVGFRGEWLRLSRICQKEKLRSKLRVKLRLRLLLLRTMRPFTRFPAMSFLNVATGSNVPDAVIHAIANPKIFAIGS